VCQSVVCDRFSTKKGDKRQFSIKTENYLFILILFLVRSCYTMASPTTSALDNTMEDDDLDDPLNTQLTQTKSSQRKKKYTLKHGVTMKESVFVCIIQRKILKRSEPNPSLMWAGMGWAVMGWHGLS
jgi:hypothetical protein